MASLYSNENFPLPVVQELRRLGHDVLTTQDAGKSGQAIPDEQVLDFAIETKRVMLTLNRRHFIRLHNERPDHQGFIVCTYDPDFSAQAQRIHLTIENQSELPGQLFRINRPQN
ncbi:MAG: DUF5615 family PIN-like protein [Anaerolineae bacterium]|nr:DUF5615 family PIN-like protein [Anaerolineae bacterium]